MKSKAIRIDLVEELKRLKDGGCIWCELGIEHPEYSQCRNRVSTLGVISAIADAVARQPGTRDRKPFTAPGGPSGDVSVAKAGREIASFGENGRFNLRMAVDSADRLRAWHLVYGEYLQQGYVEQKELQYRYSIHDALPDAATFLAEAEHKPVGTVTVFPDSPLGLPADEIFRTELDALRRQGRTPVEVGRLTISGEFKNERSILVNLFDALSLWGRCVRKATDLVITVNPSHAKFYERMLAFECIGGQKDLGSVCGAPAVLMRLDLGLEVRMRRWAHNEGPKPDEFGGGRTLYPALSGLREEQARVGRMRQAHARPGEDFLRRYFMWVRPLLTNLSTPLKYFFEKCYPDYRLFVEDECAEAVADATEALSAPESEPAPEPLHRSVDRPPAIPATAVRRKKVLFMGEAVTMAHVLRPLGLARALDGSRFDVVFACDEKYRSLVEGEGMAWEKISSTPSEEFLNRVYWAKRLYTEKDLKRFVREDLAVFGRTQPDVVVGDFRISLGISAELCGIPHIALSNAHWSPGAQLGCPVPEHPLVSLFGVKAMRRILNLTLPMYWGVQMKGFNRLRKAYGLKPVGGRGAHEVFTRGTHTAYLDVPELYDLDGLGENESYVGPVDWSPKLALPEWWEKLPAGRSCSRRRVPRAM